MGNTRMDAQVKRAILTDFHPFPKAPQHNLYSAFPDVIIVKHSNVTTSGWAAVSWPHHIKAQGGAYGDEEQRSRLIWPENPREDAPVAGQSSSATQESTTQRPAFEMPGDEESDPDCQAQCVAT